MKNGYAGALLDSRELHTRKSPCLGDMAAGKDGQDFL